MQVFTDKMGNPFSKYKKNKIAPLVVEPDPFSKALLKHAQKLIDEENALTRVSVATQTRPSFLLQSSKKKRSGTPSWLSYDVDLEGRVVKHGIKINCPTKLEKDTALPVLTLEMLLEKQEVAERKRQKHLEKKKKASRNAEDFRQRQELEEQERQEKITEMVEKQRTKLAKAAENRQALLDERRKVARTCVQVKTRQKSAENEVKRQAKIIKLTLKQQQAELNRKEQLQLVKARATNKLCQAKSKVVEVQRTAKAQLKASKNARRMKSAAANKERAVRHVVRKQQIRENHAARVRARAEKQRKEDEEVDAFDREWNAVEVDEHFCESDSDEDARWG